MPELPEVETIARGVDARVRGDRIVEVWFGSHREPFKTPPARQADGITRAANRLPSIAPASTSCWNWAERLAIAPAQRSSPEKPDEIAAQWIVHLGMTGRLLVTTPDAPVAKHTHARLTLASGRELRFVDPRTIRHGWSFATCARGSVSLARERNR